MTAHLITVADAIAEEIETAKAAEEFGNIEFTTNVLWAKRSIELEDKERGKLRVDVAPLGWSQTLNDRGSWVFALRYDIGIRKKFGSHEQEDDTGDIESGELKALVNLLSDLIGHFVPTQPTQEGRLDGVAKAVWRPEGSDMITEATINWNNLRDWRQFTGWFPLTYDYSD